MARDPSESTGTRPRGRSRLPAPHSGHRAEAIIIYLLALLLGVQMHGIAVLGVLVVVILSATLFSTLFLIIASLVKTRERFVGIGQVLTMPLFFASNAIYPVAMPTWLQIAAHVNPLTYEVDALRVDDSGRDERLRNRR